MTSTEAAHAAVQPPGHPPLEKEEEPEVVCRMLWSPATYVEDHFGEDALEQLCREANIQRSALVDPKAWMSLHGMHRFLLGVRSLVPSEEEFSEALKYRLTDAYGPLRFVLFATTPASMLTLAAQNMRLVTRHSKCEVLKHERTQVSLRYTNSAPDGESALLCHSRRAQTAAIPTLFGFPDAAIDHPRCIAWGDGECIYHCRFYTRPAKLPTAIGVTTGVVIAAALFYLALADWALWISTPVLFGLIAYIYELQQTHRSNLSHGESLQRALVEVSEQEAESRSEIFELHQRQNEWAKLMEEQVADRTASLQDVVGRIRSLGAQRVTSIQGFSHDLRNPLAVLKSNLEYLEEAVPSESDALEDCAQAVGRMQRLLEELVETAQTDSGLVRVTPVVLEVAPLVDRLRRRQRALVFGRDIRVSVFRTREAPERVRTDPLIFERVVDNLFTNAAKYTQRGSIVVELDGRPGFLTIKVSDTGRGISPTKIDAIFRPGGADGSERAPHSLGMGLSVVVQLMALIGGKIEVMSKPEVGSTFWVHFPEEITTATESFDGRAIDNVVTIRRAVNQ